MGNAYFDKEDISVLTSCSRLRLITSKISEEPPVKPGKKYVEWLDKNSYGHHHKEILVPLRGDTFFTLNGVTYPCRPGAAFLIDSDEAHDSYYPPFFRNFRHLWLNVMPKTIIIGSPYPKTAEKTASGKNFKCVFGEYNHPAQVFIEAWTEFCSDKNLDDSFKFLRVKNALSGLLLELCRAGYDKSMGMGETITEQHHRTVIDTIAAHIRETGGRNLDIARLAFIGGYSKFHFARVFKKTTGMSVLAFINLSRLDKYRELTRRGLNKKQISYELGFSCPAAFSRWLRNAGQEK